MAEDFLSKLAKTANEQIGDADSPFKTKQEATRTAQIRLSKLQIVKRIAFENDTKVVDVLDDMINIALKSSKYKNYKG